MIRKITLHTTSQQGRRPTNEDVERYNKNLNSNGFPENNLYGAVDFFVVCDGHGGADVAKFIAPELEKCFMKNNLRFPLSHNYINKQYEIIQKKLLYHPKKIAKKCGCTALVVVRYLDKNKKENIQVINLGDCRAVLSKRGLAIPLSKDQKPLWPDEKSRIEYVNKKYNRDEQIYFDFGDWRIGDLSVSRSFGDLDNVPYVTHIPESFHFHLENEDEFIIMACDGLWDVMQNHDAVNFVRDHLNNNKLEYYNIPPVYPSKEVLEAKSIARKLASYAIAKGANDNISILIIFFKHI